MEQNKIITAAVIAIERNLPVQQVPYNKLREMLEAEGQILRSPGAD